MTAKTVGMINKPGKDAANMYAHAVRILRELLRGRPGKLELPTITLTKALYALMPVVRRVVRLGLAILSDGT